MAATPERGAVVMRTRELRHFARTQGFKLDDIINLMYTQPKQRHGGRIILSVILKCS